MKYDAEITHYISELEKLETRNELQEWYLETLKRYLEIVCTTK